MRSNTLLQNATLQTVMAGHLRVDNGDDDLLPAPDRPERHPQSRALRLRQQPAGTTQQRRAPNNMRWRRRRVGELRGPQEGPGGHAECGTLLAGERTERAGSGGEIRWGGGRAVRGDGMGGDDPKGPRRQPAGDALLVREELYDPHRGQWRRRRDGWSAFCAPE